jgi:hypothetical protein
MSTESTDHRCPRRDENFLADQRFPGPDKWNDRPGYRACSFCGSQHPDEFMAALEDGKSTLIPTDKNYKAYLQTPGLSNSQIKFYFQHLSAEQKMRIVELVNDRKITFGFPGHFYTLPFFMARAK